MAICEYCKLDMSTAVGCTESTVEIGSEVYQAVKFGEEQRLTWMQEDARPDDHRCPDCNTTWGNYHHPGCDREECPKCHRQLISCGCLDQEDPEQ